MPAEAEHHIPVLGSGPWYAQALRFVGFALFGMQAVKIVDWLLPMIGLTPTVDIGTVILGGLGVALFYLGKTVEDA